MIEITKLRKSFGGATVLDGVDLTIAESERIVIIGGSGCGKSVLLRCIAGLLAPDSGSLKVDGRELTTLGEHELNPLRRQIGVLFQSSALFDSLDVFHNVAFGLIEQHAVPMEKIRHRVAEVLDVVGMGGQEAKKPAELSGGMRKRIGLARAIVSRPKVMLYDEPTTGLDPQIADSINRLILKMSETYHITSVVVTHDMTSAYMVGERLAMLHRGKILVSGTPAEIQRSMEPIVQKFIHGISEERAAEKPKDRRPTPP